MSKFVSLLITSCFILLASCAGLLKADPLAAIGQEGCLLFIQEPSGSREIWTWCEGQDKPRPLMEGMDDVLDFVVSGDRNSLFIARQNSLNGSDIWIVERGAEEGKKIFECGSSICDDLAYDPRLNRLVFSIADQSPRIIMMNLNDQSTRLFRYFAADLNFSPDGRCLSFFDKAASKLIVLNLSDETILERDAREGSIGGWSKDSARILFGASDYQGGIPGVDLYSLSVATGQVDLVFSGDSQQMEFFNPQFIHPEGFVLSAVRNRESGFIKQLVVIGGGGQIEKPITQDYGADHSAFQLNADQTRLAFQKFAAGSSDNRPEVWIYDFNLGEFLLIAQNAAHPGWVP